MKNKKIYYSTKRSWPKLAQKLLGANFAKIRPFGHPTGETDFANFAIKNTH